MVDRLKIWYFAPIYGSLGKFVLVCPWFARPRCSSIGYGATQDLGLLQVKMDGTGLLHRFISRFFLTRSARRLGSLIMTRWRRNPWISGLSLLFVEVVLIPGTGIMLGSVLLLINVVPCSYVTWLAWLASVALSLPRYLCYFHYHSLEQLLK